LLIVFFVSTIVVAAISNIVRKRLDIREKSREERTSRVNRQRNRENEQIGTTKKKKRKKKEIIAMHKEQIPFRTIIVRSLLRLLLDLVQLRLDRKQDGGKDTRLVVAFLFWLLLRIAGRVCVRGHTLHELIPTTREHNAREEKKMNLTKNK
jgi:hypothetical protein